jgi:hypothetical protein
VRGLQSKPKSKEVIPIPRAKSDTHFIACHVPIRRQKATPVSFSFSVDNVKERMVAGIEWAHSGAASFDSVLLEDPADNRGGMADIVGEVSGGSAFKVTAAYISLLVGRGHPPAELPPRLVASYKALRLPLNQACSAFCSFGYRGLLSAPALAVAVGNAHSEATSSRLADNASDMAFSSRSRASKERRPPFVRR